MAKKRKLSATKSTTTAQQSQQQPKKIQKKKQQQQQQNAEEEAKKQQQLQQQQQQQLDQEHEEEEDEEEEEEVEEYEEFEEELVEVKEEQDEEDDDEEDDEDEDEEQTKGNDVVVEGENDNDDDEPISNLLEPFTKDQLMMILREAAETHPDVASRIRNVADEDTVFRKIFVHGLGWDTTEDTLRSAFSEYGEIEDCKAVTDKVSGKSKGYGFILFKTRVGAKRALKEPQKKIGNRMTACQLASLGPVPASAGGSGAASQPHIPVSEYTQRKIYVSNVAADIDPQKLLEFFAKFGEIEEGPLGLDKQTGKPKGFCLFVYRSIESAKKALEEPHKHFEGHLLHCQKAIDGPKPGKQHMGHSRGQHFGGRAGKSNMAGGVGGGLATGAGLMGQSVGGVGFNQGAAAAAAAPLNPALGQALQALLQSQGAGLGLNNLLGTLGGAVAGVPGAASPFGAQSVGVNPTVLGGYGTQGGLQSAYPTQQMGQGGSGRSQHGHMGGGAPYSGH